MCGKMNNEIYTAIEGKYYAVIQLSENFLFTILWPELDHVLRL